jgi:3-hydroxy-9,10-secoandrosta-1,3,5(10)-triene-9,17-dione monooxygenase
MATNTATLIERAREIGESVRTRADQAEKDRMVPAASIEELKKAGLFRLLQPARYGGFELAYDSYVPAVHEIAKCCGSTGWVYSVLTMHGWHAALFPPKAQDELWGENPEALVSSSYAPTGKAVRVTGGFELTGQWSFVSGCDHTDWTIIGGVAPLSDGAAGEFLFFLVPRADYRIEDDWHVVGLAATGSKSLILEKCFVPEHRVFTARDAQTPNPPGAEVNKGPLYRIPFFVGTGHCTSVPAVGIGLGAYEDYVEDVSGRSTRGGLTGAPKRIREFATIQMRVAEAGAMVDAAERLMAIDSAALYAGAAQGDIPMDLRQRARRDFSFASRLATWAVDLLFEAEGGSGLYTNRRIQRAWRDVHAANAHIGQNWDRTATQYGRYALGLDPIG